MAIEFHCSQCGAPLRTPDGTEGAAAQCPRCRAITPVPRPGGSWPPAGSQRETVAWDGGPSAAPRPRSAEAGAGPAAAGGFAAAGASHFGGPRGSDNPYQSPGDYAYHGAWPMDDAYRQQARQRVAGPAIALIVLGIFGLVLPVIFVVFVMGVFFAVPQWLDASAIPHGFGRPPGPVAAAGALGVPLGAAPAAGATEVLQLMQIPCGFLSSIVILWGGIWMKNLRGYGLATAASIIAMVPCFSPCCLLGIPIGIWALVVLSEPGVKAAFS